ncbi:hypothetical protein ScPMuIL_015002 [Solemya velum]
MKDRQCRFFCAILLSLSMRGAAVVPLYIGCLLAQSTHWWHNYAMFFPCLWESVFEEVSNRSDILPGYELRLVCKDTEGKPGLASKRFIELIQEQPSKLALIGPALSDETSQVGKMTPFFNMLQITFSSRTATISDRETFSSLYMTNYLEEDLNPMRIALMKYFGWERVGTIYYQEDMFVSQMSYFHHDLKQNNFTLLTTSVYTETKSVAEYIRRLKQHEVRIIMGAFRASKAGYIFCEAYKQGLYGKKYLWILSGSQMYDNWIASSPDNLPCTKEELYTATKGYLTLEHTILSRSDKPTISGRTPKEFVDLTNRLVQGTGFQVSRSTPWVYDAGWALALALNHSLQFLGDKKLEDFTYNDTGIFDAIVSGIQTVSFVGVSGPVSFLKDGRRVGVGDIVYNADDTKTTTATYDPITDKITWLVDPKSLFAGQIPPKDRFTYIEAYVTPSYTAVACVLLLNCIGCIVAVGFLVFNISYRHNRHIKMSSPNINNIIVIGGVIMYMSVILRVLDYTNITIGGSNRSHSCMIEMWVVSIGFTTSFGALFSKTWRVHILFRLDTFQKRVIKDIQLLGIIILLWLIDGVLLTLWSALHALVREDIRIKSTDADEDVVITTIYTNCYNKNQVYWYAAIYIYKGLLLVFGTFLAWETRMVQIPALNDSKLIGFCVYNIVVVCAFGVPIGHVLPTEQTTLKFVLVSLLTIFCTTLVLCIVFVPKLKLRNQTSNIMFVKTMKNGESCTCATSSLPGQSTQERSSFPMNREIGERESSVNDGNLQKVKLDNDRLRMEMAKETIAVGRLRRKIMEETGLQFNKVDGDYIVSRREKQWPSNHSTDTTNEHSLA